MRFLLLVSLLLPALGSLVHADAKDDEGAKELKKLEGTWVMVAGEKEGQPLAAEHVKKSKLVYKGKEVEVDTPHQAKETIKATVVSIDPTKKPREMEWVRANGP